MTIRNLEFAFQPKSVALIGASGEAGSVGLTVLRNLRTGGFSGPVWMVNPNHAEVEGVRCYPNAAALPETPDLAVIATPAETVPAIITELCGKGTRAAVVLTAGLTKANGLRQDMLDAAKPFCMRLIGPNCLGVFVPQIGLNASFAHIHPNAGHLALLSQSGAVAARRSTGRPRGISASAMWSRLATWRMSMSGTCSTICPASRARPRS